MYCKDIIKNSIILGPMEGISDICFRKAVHHHFKKCWDYYYTDFYRLSSHSVVTEKNITNHLIGKKSDETLLKKTVLQILSPNTSYLPDSLKIIENMGIKLIDFNLGCPSRTVVAHKGGSYLLKDLNELQRFSKIVRKSFSGNLSFKIRTGFHDDSNFPEILKILSGEGANIIVVHGRTRDQLYKGEANWEVITKALSIVDIPIIINGDIKSQEDLSKLSNKGFHSFMVSRGALIRPSGIEKPTNLTTIIPFLKSFSEYIKQTSAKEEVPLKRLKSLIHYLAQDNQKINSIRSTLLRSKTEKEFFITLNGNTF